MILSGVLPANPKPVKGRRRCWKEKKNKKMAKHNILPMGVSTMSDISTMCCRWLTGGPISRLQLLSVVPQHLSLCRFVSPHVSNSSDIDCLEWGTSSVPIERADRDIERWRAKGMTEGRLRRQRSVAFDWPLVAKGRWQSANRGGLFVVDSREAHMRIVWFRHFLHTHCTLCLWKKTTLGYV